jgi:hypothetical protein
MKKADIYRERLMNVDDLDTYLMKESGLPGPRGNIELSRAVADWGDEATFKHLLSYDPDNAPTNTPGEFLAFCGTVGMGKLLADGDMDKLAVLRAQASDPRWRIREGVAMALQRYGAKDMEGLIQEMRTWSEGNALEKRAAIAALCEPALLKKREDVVEVLSILDDITRWVTFAHDRKSDDFKALRKGLGYCWSVAVAADPEEGKRVMESLFFHDDPDVLWIMKENLTKKRLERMDPAWVAKWKARYKMI